MQQPFRIGPKVVLAALCLVAGVVILLRTYAAPASVAGVTATPVATAGEQRRTLEPTPTPVPTLTPTATGVAVTATPATTAVPAQPSPALPPSPLPTRPPAATHQAVVPTAPAAPTAAVTSPSPQPAQATAPAASATPAPATPTPIVASATPQPTSAPTLIVATQTATAPAATVQPATATPTLAVALQTDAPTAEPTLSPTPRLVSIVYRVVALSGSPGKVSVIYDEYGAPSHDVSVTVPWTLEVRVAAADTALLVVTNDVEGSEVGCEIVVGGVSMASERQGSSGEVVCLAEIQ